MTNRQAPMRLHVDEEITFRKLEVLLAFMETGNLTRAAELLDVSTVSVHRALHSLEEGLRCSLFRLEGRNLHPTEAAYALAEVARDVLRRMSEGINTTRNVAGYSASRIRIGSLYSLTVKTVPEVIIALKVRKAELMAELVPGRVRDVFPDKVRFIPLQPRFLMRQTIALNFLRTRERDPNLLTLLAVCRCAKAALR